MALALQALAARGFFFVSHEPKQSADAREVGKRLGFSREWVLDHLTEFPNAWRANGGEVRIPLRDVDAYEQRRRIKRS